MKKVSMVIINYNDKVRVKRAIDSCINQTYKNVEVIVVDDGSDEETRKLYKAYEDIIFIQLEKENKTDRTPSKARNAGIEKSTGDYICFLDSDNYYSSDFVEEMVKHDKPVMFCNWEIIGLQNYKSNIEQVWNFNNPLLQNYLQFQHVDHQCLLFKKSILEKTGVYDNRLPRSQDCDLIVRIILTGEPWHHVPKCLFHFEKHEEDQMKQVASIYGKTLWSLKNNISIQWIQGLLKDPILIVSFLKAVDNFSNSKEWENDFIKSDFKLLLEKHNEILNVELKEVCQN